MKKEASKYFKWRYIIQITTGFLHDCSKYIVCLQYLSSDTHEFFCRITSVTDVNC